MIMRWYPIENPNGRFDVCVLPENILGTVVLIECKHSISEDDLIDDAKEGARQIVEKISRRT